MPFRCRAREGWTQRGETSQSHGFTLISIIGILMVDSGKSLNSSHRQEIKQALELFFSPLSTKPQAQ